MANGVWDADLFRSRLSASIGSVLDEPCDAEGLREAVAASAQAAERVCGGRPSACGAGCPHCCVLNVSVLLPEVMIIAGWLRGHLPEEEWAAMHERIAAHRSRVRWMDDEERIFAGVRCPFLDEAGSCIIHPVRPLACRGAASLDSNACRDAFRPFDPYAERLVPADLLRRSAYDAAFTALADVLLSHRLDDRSIELSGGVLAFQRQPELIASYLRGERLPGEIWE